MRLKHFPNIGIFSKYLNDLMIMSLVWFGIFWYGLVQFGMVWYDFQPRKVQWWVGGCGHLIIVSLQVPIFDFETLILSLFLTGTLTWTLTCTLTKT